MTKSFDQLNVLLSQIKEICDQYKGTKLYQSSVLLYCEDYDGDPSDNFEAIVHFSGPSIQISLGRSSFQRIEMKGNGSLIVKLNQEFLLNPDGTIARNYNDNWEKKALYYLNPVLWKLQEDYDQRKQST